VEAMDNFNLSGLTTIMQRINHFKNSRIKN